MTQVPMTDAAAPQLSRRWILLAGLAVVLFQLAVPGSMIADRVALLTTGREITIKTEPVDPRSLFQGDYVILSYPITLVSLAGVPAPEALYMGDKVYAVISPGEGDAWRLVSLSEDWPENVAATDVVLDATVASAWGEGDGRRVRLEYGIEAYFVPEGTGKELEDLVRTGELSVIVAVSDTGRAGIKGLVIDGERIYNEPLL